MYLLPIKSKIFVLLTIFYCQNSFGQNVGIGTNNPLTRLHITGGSDASLGGGGFLQIGNLNALNVVIDDNEIMARINGSAATLSLNNDGGNIILGAAEGANIGIGTNAPAERLHMAAGNIRLDNSTHGINLNGADRAMITRRFDVFSSGIHQGLGRWGLFMEPSRLTLGIPNVPGKEVAISKYNANSVAIPILTINENGALRRPSSGISDLLPIAMGTIRGNNTNIALITGGSGNFNAVWNETLKYWELAINGHNNIELNKYLIITTGQGCKTAYSNHPDFPEATFNIRTYNLNNNDIQEKAWFSFVVYKLQ